MSRKRGVHPAALPRVRRNTCARSIAPLRRRQADRGASPVKATSTPATIIKLASNENPRGPSPKVLALERSRRRRAICAVIPDGNGYALKAALAARRLGRTKPRRDRARQWQQRRARTGDAGIPVPGRPRAVYSQHAFIVYPRWRRVRGVRRAPRSRRRIIGHRSRRDACRDRAAHARGVRCQSQQSDWNLAALPPRSIRSWPRYRATSSSSSTRPMTSSSSPPDPIGRAPTAWISPGCALSPPGRVAHVFQGPWPRPGLRIGYGVMDSFRSPTC